jgi:hypothetical protein
VAEPNSSPSARDAKEPFGLLEAEERTPTQAQWIAGFFLDFPAPTKITYVERRYLLDNAGSLTI